MEPGERRVLEELDGALRSARARAAIAAIVARVDRDLADKPTEALMAWEPVPLDTYDGLPDDVRSSWVFVLRAGAVTGAERHPNSRQRMTSWRGGGDFQTKPGERWRSHPMRSEPDAPFEERWISIPPGVWHQGVVGDEDWAVVSFQTAAVDELIEERPAEGGATVSRNYVEPHGP